MGSKPPLPVHLRYPPGCGEQAEALWRQLQEIGCPIDVLAGELSIVEDHFLLDGALAEAHVCLDEHGQPTHCLIRLSPVLMAAPRSEALNTLLHEAIHLRFARGPIIERARRAEQIRQNNIDFQGTTRDQRNFEEQRISLARLLYFFPEEVIAEEYLRDRYPSRAVLRLEQYAGMQERFWTTKDYAMWLAPLRVPATFLHYLRNRLGMILVAGSCFAATFEERADAYRRKLEGLSTAGRDQLWPLADRLLAATADPLEWDEGASEAAFELARSIPIPD